MSLVAIDFETYLIDKAHPYPKPVCVSYYNGWQKKLVTEGMGYFLDKVLDKTIIAHNAVFECGVIYHWFPELRQKMFNALADGRVICTKINEQLYNAQAEKPQYKVSLADLVQKYFKKDISEGKKDPDAWRYRYSELDGVPKEYWPEEAVEYAIMDSVWAHKVFKKQPKVKYQRAVEAAVYLNLMGKTGIKVDQERVYQLEEEIYKILTPKYKSLIDKEFCQKVKNVRRPKKNMKKLREYVEQVVEHPVYSAKGTIKTDKEALLTYYEQTEDEVFKDFLDINEYDKVLTAYIKNLKADLIRTEYSTTKSTGRTSSSSSRLYPSVNIQQMPRKVPGVTWDVRNCFVPREGFKLVSIDYSGLELASAAHQLYNVFGRSAMRDMLNSGDHPVDLHSMLASRIMSMHKNREVTYEEFVFKKKEGEYAEYRQLCKAINLGFPGGIGYNTMRYILLQGGTRTKYKILERSRNKYLLQLKCRQLKSYDRNIRVNQLGKYEWALVYDELVGLKENMFKVYPELELFLKEYHKRAQTGKTKWMKDDFGEWEEEPMHKYEVFDFKRNWCTYTAYCNGFLMQSPSAVGATQMVSQVVRKYLEHPDMNPLAFIHDEILFEVKDNDNKYNIINDVSEIMIDEMQKRLTSVRISVEAEVMPYWMKSGGEWSREYWKDEGGGELRYEGE